MKHKDIRFVRTEQVLMNVMLNLLEQKRFESITINDICEAASISRTAFYRHYEDKYSLVVRCITELVYEIPQQEGGSDIKTQTLCMLTAVKSRRKALQNLQKLEGSRELQQKVDHTFMRIYLNYYKDRERKGASFSLPLEPLAIYHCNGVMALVSWWIRRDCADPKETILHYIMQLHEANLLR